MANAVQGKIVRIQLDFTERAFDRVKRLRQKTGANSNAEVIGKALHMYEWFILKKEEEGLGSDEIKQVH